DFELIVVDDGSTDDTRKILDSIADKDPRMRVIEGPSKGLPHALNTGLAHCRSALVARMDADDISRPERLERQFQFMTENQDIAVVGCHARRISTDATKIDTWRTPSRPDEAAWRLPLGCTIPHPGAMF